VSTPVKINLEANKDYYYCTCGKSEDGIFCNGAHQGTEFTPKVFSVEKTKEYYLCPCKKTEAEPFCDGAHTK